MTVYRDEKQEEKINEAYKKIIEGDKEKIDEIIKGKEDSFKWTKGVNDAYKKVMIESEEGAEKMVAALEKKSGKKYSPEEREKLKKKFMANMKK